MAGDENPADEPTQFIVNELLASAAHALLSGKTPDDIAQTFALFYDENAIRAARDALEKINILELPHRSRRKDFSKLEVKVKEIKDVVDSIVKYDATAKTFPFVATNFNQICHVDGGLSDSLQMRHDIHKLQTRLLELEKICGGLTNIHDTVDKLVKTVSTNQVKSSTYRDAAAPTAPKVPQNIPLIKSSENRVGNILPTSMTTPEITAASTPVENSASHNVNRVKDWTTVHKKRKRPKLTVGQADSQFVSESQVRPLRVYLSRFKKGTEVEHVKQCLTNELNWELINVESLNSKSVTFDSFKVTVNRNGKSISECLKPDLWPKGVIFRLFHEPISGQRSAISAIQGSPPSPSWRR